jgi:3-oxoacyl-[acyl-carrier protein] reductase
MDLQLEGKTALVTGASQGIGRAIAKGLAAEGVRVCITARRAELLEELAKEIRAAGGKEPLIVGMDMMEKTAPAKLAKAALEGLGQVNILVNCAGYSTPLSWDADDDIWEKSMTMNFARVRQLTHALLPDMIKHKWGRVINITGKSESVGLNASFSAKAGVHAWQKGLTKEVSKHGITINSVPPGRIMSEQILRLYSEKDRAEFSEREIPTGRYGEPEELAVVAVFLASPLAGYVNGVLIPVDGGLRRYSF